MEYEVELPDEPTDGLFRGRVYVRTTDKAPRELIASFTATTWRHVQDEARTIREAHKQERTYVFDEHDFLVSKDSSTQS